MQNRILVVASNAIHTELCSQSLNHAGYHIETCNSFSLDDCLLEQPPDLIVCHYETRESKNTIIKFLQEMQIKYAKFKRIPVLLTVAYTDCNPGRLNFFIDDMIEDLFLAEQFLLKVKNLLTKF